jgi:Phosphorylase superfamily
MNNFLNIKFILVPQGTEYHAVSQGLKNNLYPLPQILQIPVGGESVRKFLRQWLETNNFTGELTTDNLINAPRVLVMGLCGSLSPELKVGDIVVYENFRQPTNSDILFTNSPFTAELFQYLSQKTTQIKELKNQVSLVMGLTSNSVISTAVEKRSLYECYGANVVDMEGYAILEVLNEVGFSVATIRIVSDDCFHDIPNLTSAFNPDGSLNVFRLVFAMLRKPMAAIRLIRGSLHGLTVLKLLSSHLKITD